jgi:hypothetical protein
METVNTGSGATQPFNPLNDKVNEKTYAGGGTAGVAGNMDIPEPIFNPPPLDLEGSTPSASDGDKTKKDATKKVQEPFNQEMNELSDPEKKKAAEQAATFAMTMYKGLHTWGNSMIRISDKKINKLQSSGEIDLRVGVPYGQHGFVQLGEFINEYNTQAGEVLQVAPEWEEAVMPALTRVLAKRGAGMTDENFLMFMVGQDVLSKSMTVVNMRRTTNDILAFAKEQTSNGRMYRPQATMAMPQQPVQEAAPVSHEAPIVQMTESPVVHEGTTLQEQALNRVRVDGGNGGNILPEVGKQSKLDTMNQVYERELKEKQKSEKLRKGLGKSNQVPKPRRKRNNGVPGAKKETRGRKPGQKNTTNPTPTAK